MYSHRLNLQFKDENYTTYHPRHMQLSKFQDSLPQISAQFPERSQQLWSQFRKVKLHWMHSLSSIRPYKFDRRQLVKSLLYYKIPCADETWRKALSPSGTKIHMNWVIFRPFTFELCFIAFTTFANSWSTYLTYSSFIPISQIFLTSHMPIGTTRTTLIKI